ncbi:MAG: hypothetical protein M2R45_01331 [Verrucomicrobia subdivision 3 bacterium]|nr:hypothetical protein [Limisphaerales bacterium]MCS1415197.1 hypothetical protein [Limisphaerales bacterium]
MKNHNLHETILRAARKLPDDTRVPYAFEKRIMARLTSQSQPDSLDLWARGLWQATIPCLTLMFAISAWSMVATGRVPSIDPLATDLELTMIQPFDELDVEYLW